MSLQSMGSLGIAIALSMGQLLISSLVAVAASRSSRIRLSVKAMILVILISWTATSWDHRVTLWSQLKTELTFSQLIKH